jgi:hypothetical protein
MPRGTRLDGVVEKKKNASKEEKLPPTATAASEKKSTKKKAKACPSPPTAAPTAASIQQAAPTRTKVTTESDVATMPPGKYYVGDPCYVLGDTAHGELCKMISPESEGMFATGIEGKHVLSDGRTVVLWKCPEGDGVYKDQNGRFYMVDSGCLGITLLEGLEEQWEHPHPKIFPKETFMDFIMRLGNIVEYDSEFHVNNVTVQGAYQVARMSFGKKVSIKA